MFIDEIKILARAGHGGPGCVAFHREAFAPKGGPSGGNGGRGGNVILEASHDLNNLIAQFYQPRLIAKGGEAGLGKGMDGHAAKDIIIKVPCGTLVWKLPSDPTPAAEPEEPETFEPPKPPPGATIRHSGAERAIEFNLADEPEVEVPTGIRDKGVLVADLTKHGEQFILCKGGRGGLGNRNFATARRQTPRFAQPGEPGDEGNYLFELRMMAEVGLVGYPNAGKSTLLTAISRARPKVAAYPFTTLTPQVGILEYPDHFRLTICDVPGVIEGAHKNLGLGHKFLRHIERCKVIVILLDMAGTDARNPWDDYKQLLIELELFDPSFVTRKHIVVANKMDEEVSAKNLTKFKRRVPKTPVLPISAAFDQGMDVFKAKIRAAVEQALSAKS